jgi:flagellar motor protein MotB
MRKASVDGAQSLRVFETYRGVEVLLPADRVFVADSAEISASSSALIALVASVAKGLPKAQRVVVEVPADAGEATTEHAWRLATQRAETLAQRLQDESGLGPARMIPAAAGVRRGQRSVTFLVEATLAGRPGPSRGTP